MRFWDSSAILPLLLHEERSAAAGAALTEDPLQAVWCLAEVELVSGIARRSREGLAAEDAARARSRLEELADHWREVSAIESVRRRAVRLLSTHTLRAADALQLAAALVLSEERPESLSFVCLDDRLREAACKEGFPVLPS
jgi:predicted nucleic acid-binding protein